MKKIIVLLSSYNGEKYIREQLDSLLLQEGVEISIVVRDDGSNDGTLQILEEYEELGKITVIRGENIGWKKSFMELLYTSPEADYYAFCDQDDIWLPNKLISAVKKLEEMPSQEPNLYGSNLRFYKDGVDMGLVRKNDIAHSLYTSLVANLTAGCTMVFNKVLRDLIHNNPPQIDFPHDYWIYQVASLLGNVYYDQESYILYRQHDNNQIGTTNSVLSLWKNRFGDIKGLFCPQGRKHSANELLRLYGQILSDNKKDIVKRVAFYDNSLYNRFYLLFNKNYSMGSWDSNIGLKLRILFGSL